MDFTGRTGTAPGRDARGRAALEAAAAALGAETVGVPCFEAGNPAACGVAEVVADRRRRAGGGQRASQDGQCGTQTENSLHGCSPSLVPQTSSQFPQRVSLSARW